MKAYKVDKLTVEIYENRVLMGEAAAKDIKQKIAELLAVKPEINMIFAAAPSQNDVLKALAEDKEIEWNRVNAYHMDEYIGLDKNAPQCFGNFLKDHIFGLAPFKTVNYIDVTAKDPDAEAERYGKILDANLTDIVVMGIGENILFIYKGRNEWQGSKDQIMTSTNERLNSFIFASDLFRKVKEANK